MSLQVNISKKLNGILLNIEFESSDECLGILGASGCGKSMTLKCIAGIEKPDRGEIVLNGRVLYSSEKRISLTPQQRKVGYLFQNYALFPNMTVEKNIGAGLKLSNAEKKMKIDEMIRMFHLEGLEGHYPVELSGGQQQRVALARMLAYEPDVLMLDEPFSALDTYLKEQLQMEMQKVMKDYGGDVLLVTHSRDEVYRFCKNVIVMDQGNIVNKGDMKAIFKNPHNITTARLSGCKNISRIKKISDYTVVALDWGITLKTSIPVSDDIRYLGIRAHDLKPTEGCNPDEDNIFELSLMSISEGPFELNIILSNQDNKKESADNSIWWKVGQEEWRGRLKERVPRYFRVAPEDIILLRE